MADFSERTAGRRPSRDEAREERRREAARHTGLMRAAFAAETAETLEGARIYEEGEGRALPLPEPMAEVTETRVVTSFAPEALYHHGAGKCVVVDPAAFTRPGGAYEDGAFGPEQILCAESNLYPVLQGIADEYHRKNRDYRRGSLFTDRAAYLPAVLFSRGGDVRRADVIALPEPVRGYALENHRSERECDKALADRIETILRIAAANGAETLVVGAFGCGRNGYEPAQVIELFRVWIAEHPGSIARIVFAVPRLHADAFRAVFGAAEPERPVAVSAAAEDDSHGEDEDWRDVELPEGITLR
ncbi:TIGR02452 family protein [Enterorhabdus mucosicola]|uniref:TIGR02452 family protein n=1 Tax=Adlercreutzia mucosicola TaxID=580026 RepID=A0A6N8JQ33_9ACTN|nr:TIGR02452 family protein [Adlercreutzia mucosicola]MVX60910.1 TIGR02452 family protein [Adlercreutzia mucosicola]